jgi:hypothetical protein
MSNCPDIALKWRSAMVAEITLDLSDPGNLIGIRKLELMLDGKLNRDINFGGNYKIECAPGDHAVQIITHGWLRRQSNVLRVATSEGRSTKLIAQYSRLWGNIKLVQA